MTQILLILKVCKLPPVLDTNMLFFVKKIKNNKSGATALLTVLIIGAATLIMAVSASFLSMGELDLGYTAQKGGETFALTDGCMEDALRHLRIDNGYIGGTLNFGAKSCIINITANGLDKTVNVVGTFGNYNKEIEVDLTLSGNVIAINSWIEK